MAKLKLKTRQIEFEMTNRCNASCVFCPRHDPRQKGLIELKTIKAGVNLAKAAGIKGFKISGFGEPTLHPKLVEYLQYIRKEVPDAFILLITNGQLFTPALFDALAAIPVDRINISFNGFDKKSYEAQMKQLKFDTVMENLRYIAANNPAGIDIQFVPILSKLFGPKDVEKMKDLLKGIGFSGDNFKYHHVITWRSEKLDKTGLVDAEFIKNVQDMEIKDKTKIVCLAHLSNLYVSWQGTIHICCQDIYGEAVIGKIFDLKTAADLKKLEDENIKLRANYSFEVCQKCDRPLTLPHHDIDGTIFTSFS
ncbi:radical SAM/SPASM domain-containing protein [Candidatus Margulisiibacteriota bacterium]